MRDYSEEAALTSLIDELEKFSEASRYPTLSYVAIKSNGYYQLLRGRLSFYIDSMPDVPKHVATNNIIAGRIPLQALSAQPRQIIEDIQENGVAVSEGLLRLIHREDGNNRLTYHNFHPDAAQSQTKTAFLRLKGVPIAEFVPRPDTDWELMAAEEPYGGLDEIFAEFGLLMPDGNHSAFEVMAFAVAGFDGSQSTLLQGNAKVTILLANNLNRKNLRLSYRVIKIDGSILRTSVSGDDLSWSCTTIQRGLIEFTVPERAVVHCCVSYNELPQSHWWLVDQTSWPNHLRGVYDIFDENLDSLRAIFSSSKKGDARSVEAGVSMLLWMFGFSPLYLGVLQRISDAPDVIAQTPSGDIVVVECTTSFLNNDNKPLKLLERVNRVKLSLAGSHRHLRVLPVLVTTKQTNEVSSEIASVKRLGIAVVCADDLLSVLDRTFLRPNPEQFFNDAWAAATEAMSTSAAS